ncbi:Hydroxyacylglutathione hydrolase [Penicillium herquei]|nr:Hydroxyacylglutathione hydrolase [Penicillium herquei]
MAKVIFTAWKNKSQLLDVRNEFYPPTSYDGPDRRAHACAVVEAWKLRGNVPHHVEATALLTDAILHDDAQTNSIFSIRATYSAAFCRFVTGLVDTKIHGQRRTMFQRAMDLGLPASFVELRHEATHREPPSLVVLRKASQRSLEWLWDNYWADVDGLNAGSQVSHDASASIKTALTGVLREFSRHVESSEPQRKKRKRDHEVSVATDLVSICGSSTDGVKSLSAVLLEESLLFGSERKIGESMNQSFDKWDPVLQKISDTHPSFLTYLCEDLVHSLLFDATKDSQKNASAEALFLWLTHILSSFPWASYQQYCPRAYILSACDETATYWAKMLSDRLKEHGGVRKSKSSRRSSLRSAVKNSTLSNANSDASSIIDEKLSAHGWAPVERWDSRALGVAATARTGKGNNYAYLVTDEPTKHSVIIDPANPPEVAPELKSQISAGKIDLTAIVNTHHHWDHAGGNDGMLKEFGKLPVIGGSNCQSVTQTPAHGETFKIGERITVKALHTPCHTQDSICYFMQDGDQRVVFTGDTLFIGGCGRFFEGNAAEMHKALNETLASLPDDTKVYPGHEYTKQNVKFCIAVSQSEPIKKLEAFAEANQQTQGKFTIGDEKLHNVFMRVNDPEIQKATGKTAPVDVMAALREMKNAM